MQVVVLLLVSRLHPPQSRGGQSHFVGGAHSIEELHLKKLYCSVSIKTHCSGYWKKWFLQNCWQNGLCFIQISRGIVSVMTPAVELSKFYEQHKVNSIHLHFTVVEVDIDQAGQIKLDLQVCLHTRKYILG